MARERGVWGRAAGTRPPPPPPPHLEKRAVDVEARAVGLLEGELDGGAPREVRQLGVLLRRQRLIVPEDDEPLELGDLLEERGVRLRRLRRAGGELRFERRHPRVELGDERLRLRGVLGGHALHQRRRLAARHPLRLGEHLVFYAQFLQYFDHLRRRELTRVPDVLLSEASPQCALAKGQARREGHALLERDLAVAVDVEGSDDRRV